MNCAGIGDPNSLLNVFMGNRPPHAPSSEQTIQPLVGGEIHAIGQADGNGWRKVFNVYAKLVFALQEPSITGSTRVSCWQDYREQYLLQANSRTSLHFEPPPSVNSAKINILMGRTFGKSVPLASNLEWLNSEFAIDYQQNLIVSPYFDYRQLSNQKIVYLVELIRATFKQTI